MIVASDIIALFNEKIKKPAELNTKYKSDYSDIFNYYNRLDMGYNIGGRLWNNL